jgi:hypothetical protein
MKKKPSSGTRLPVSNPGPHKAVLNWRNVPVEDLFLYARSFHTAAKKLAGSPQLDATPFTDFDACPVVFMYRHAVELQLKALVLGEGGNFLATKPDPISIYKTHSVSWLAQFVCQIVTALTWEKEFRCEGIENLADFKAVVEDINSVDPGPHAFRYPVNTEGQGSVPGQVKLSVREFARRMDALVELLASTADALAAEWDLRSGGATETNGSVGGFEPVIQ